MIAFILYIYIYIYIYNTHSVKEGRNRYLIKYISHIYLSLCSTVRLNTKSYDDGERFAPIHKMQTWYQVRLKQNNGE